MLSHNYAFGGIEAQKSKFKSQGIEVVNYSVDLKRYLYLKNKIYSLTNPSQ